MSRTLCGWQFSHAAISSQAQTFTRFEIGGQITNCIDCDAAQLAIGPEATLNFNQHFALDSSLVFSPKTPDFIGETEGGHSVQFLTGAKASIRSPRLTLFAKARPGFVRWDHAITGVTSTNPIEFSFGSRMYFALNFAGGVQVAISPRIRLDAELGDTRFRLTNILGHENNVQISTGISYSPGNLKLVHREAAASHRFFDRTNVLLLSAGVLAQVADGVTTQRNQANCRRFNTTIAPFPLDCAREEANPLARPFVTQGWAGQVALIGLVTSGEVLLMHTIHRLGYHKVERIVPIPLAIGNAHAAYDNLQNHR